MAFLILPFDISLTLPTDLLPVSAQRSVASPVGVTISCTGSLSNYFRVKVSGQSSIHPFAFSVTRHNLYLPTQLDQVRTE